MKIPTSLQYFIIGIVLLLLTGGIAYYVGNRLLERSNDIPYEAQAYQTIDGGDCNIAVVPLTGQLWASQANADAETAAYDTANTSAQEIVAAIQRAKDDSSIKGVVLRVDSPGGSPTGGEMIANALKTLGKPSAAVIEDEGDSAAYLSSTGANTIIASAFSDVADIGVTSSFVDDAEGDSEEGKQFVKVSAGEYKDVGDPDMAVTPADQAYLQALVDDNYKTFVNEVAANRGMSTTTVQGLANGDSLTGQMALGTGLIDSIGDAASAQKWFATKLGKGSDPVLCD